MTFVNPSMIYPFTVPFFSVFRVFRGFLISPARFVVLLLRLVRIRDIQNHGRCISAHLDRAKSALGIGPAIGRRSATL